MVPSAEPETVAVKSTSFKGAVPEEGLAVRVTERSTTFKVMVVVLVIAPL